ncbi:MAG: tRNA (adenosine(37)-N6)-dimethylallyltransferase MiaA [Proteobacteria bacterium]|nr:MAG: tRNA (adenosine(37)-N6)-dimethylallyltransferase MiaA [Pseudomonadota bacterium]PIE40405.1 MAG: tRNA (adenosine(37)-N6)-dimethylallyltransferase MiaA [Gammaproteobacteria bacterium]
MGPTAAGKTELAIELVQEMNCEIISVDSAMIYRGMDIGTAKPRSEELAKAPHRLIDIRDPSEVYSASEFREDALRHMADIAEQGKTPLLVGGTMMYFKALRQGMASMPGADPELRKEIEKQAERAGWGALYRELLDIDPFAAGKIHPNNRQRLIRAIEVYRLSGKPISGFWFDSNKGKTGQTETTDYTNWEYVSFGGLPYNVINFAIAPRERKDLHTRIEQRFMKMLEAGFIDEVRALHQRDDLHADLPSVRCVGYRQVWDFLDANLSREEMVAKGVAATRQLAKRQLTWLRNWPDVHWIETEDVGKFAKVRRIVGRSM